MLDTVAASRGGGGGGGTPRGGPSLPEGLVLIKNDSDDDASAFDVLGIDNILFGPDDNLPEFQRNPVLSCVTPALPDHAGKFVVLYESIPAGAIGRAWITGTCRVQVDVAAESDQYADVADGIATKLASGRSGGVQILYKQSGTGTKWAVVRFGANASPVVRLLLVSRDTRYGKFGWINAQTLSRPQPESGALDPTQDVTQTMLYGGNLADMEGGTGDCYAVSAIEVRMGQYILLVGADVTSAVGNEQIGFFLDFAPDGKPVYEIFGPDYNLCAPPT